MQKSETPHIALITGGSSGIGLAIAKALAAQELQVIIADKAEPVENLLGIHFEFCDVSKGKDIDALYQRVTGNFGIPDVLVLNAGRGIREKLCEGDPEKWKTILDTNIMGALRCIRAFVPPMQEQKSGNVIFISSVSAHQPHPYGAIYSASKTALEVIAETLRLETIPYLHVSIISPGITDTSFFENQVSATGSASDLKMGCISPEEIADDVLYILNKKPGTSINKMITRPIAQAF